VYVHVCDQIFLDRFDINQLSEYWNSSTENTTQDFWMEKTMKHSDYSTNIVMF